jgi:hypothetical protein
MRIQSLWRYPVKSMQGEDRNELIVEWGGVSGDRSFGVVDITASAVISAKREGRLLEATATLTDAGLRITLPDGREFSPGTDLDDNLSCWLERPVTLVGAATHGSGTYECQEDFEQDESASVRWDGPEGSFVDESQLHLLTSADLAQLVRERPELQWDVRRFRPNVVVDVGTEAFEPWQPGERYRLGEVEIEIEKACSRCVMTTRPQPGHLDRQLEVLRHVSKTHGNDVGVRARVRRTGIVRVGDPVTWLN